jgi:outer membrane protein TolC
MQIKKQVWLAFSLAAAAAVAQTDTRPIREISLEECVEMALKNNFTLQIDRFEPKISEWNVNQAKAAYDPNLSFNFSSSFNASPSKISQVIPVMIPGAKNTAETLGASIGGVAPNGLQWSVPFDFTRRHGDNFPLTKQYEGVGGIDLRQPLLKGGGMNQTRYQLLVSKKGVKISEFVLRQTMTDVVAKVQQAYYELIAARENVKVQEKAVSLAERLLKDNQAKVRAGTLPPLDEKQAESEVATKRADLLDARQLQVGAENVLKNLIVSDLANWRMVNLTPSQSLLAVPFSFDLQESWRIGLLSRSDLMQFKLDVERRELDVNYYKNLTKPDLSLIGRYGHNAAGTGAEDVLRGVREDNFTYHTWGAELSFPIGNRAAKARMFQGKDARLQAELRVKQLEQNIMVEIDNALSKVRSSFDRIDATRQARVYAEAALDAEQKKLENGKSTSYTVLQIQRDLTNAKSAEIKSLTDYNKAVSQSFQSEGTTLERSNIKFQ